ncbi:MAG TPA: hypothetical protein VKT99_24085 [Xanthobacteraceae bacterium]|jgi:hypothetical protein|nr:hypothetical protein [Xanthobacteraceae bacterium]
MPHRVNSLVSAIFASSLAAAMWLGSTRAASAADECFEKPGQEARAGHWYYYADRVHHRRCWFFEPSQKTVSPRPSTEQTPAANTDSQQSWFFRFTHGVAQTLSPEPKQNGISAVSPESPQNNISAYSSDPPQTGISDNSGPAPKVTSPRRLKTNKTAKREQPRVVPPPTTTGLGSTERSDQLPAQPVAEKDDKQPGQLGPAERQELFEDFLKWYRDRSIFGQP